MATAVGQAAVRLGRTTNSGVLGCAYNQQRNSSSTPGHVKTVSNVKRGKGGRSSFSGNVVTVFGGTGYFGGFMINSLGKSGNQIVIPYRCDPYKIMKYRVAADLGQTLFFPLDIRDENAVYTSMKHSNIVINLIGSDVPTKNFSLHDANVKSAVRIASIAKAAGVERLIHFSAMCANPNPPSFYIPGGSVFAKTKYEGEQRVRDIFPEATIFRPADMFGNNDKFLKTYCWKERAILKLCIPMYKCGEETVKQPVYFGDVTKGVMAALNDKSTAGQVYEAVGPQRYYLRDIIEFINAVRRCEYVKIINSPFFYLWKIKLQDAIKKKAIITPERFEKEFISDVLSGQPTLEDLGLVNLVKMPDQAKYELKWLRKDTYYEEMVGQFADPENPPEEMYSRFAPA